MSITIPHLVHRTAPRALPVPRARHEDDRVATASDVRVAVGVGRFEWRSVARYLALWSLVLFVVELLVFAGGYAALARLGVLESASRATATVFGENPPDSGVLPALEFDALLPWAVAVSGAIAVLWLIGALAVVLVHNCISAMHGGPRINLR